MERKALPSLRSLFFSGALITFQYRPSFSLNECWTNLRKLLLLDIGVSKVLLTFFTVVPKLEMVCDALRDLIPFVQFKKREKLP